MSDTDELISKNPLLSKCLDESEDVTTKDVFGWDTIGDTRIPYILRGEEHYLSVRMVENKLLSKYPSAYPEEISKIPPLANEFITTEEATLLDEINRDHCDHGFGHDLFTTDDIIVKVGEFKDFFHIVQKHFGKILLELDPAEKIKQLDVEPEEVIKHNPGKRQVTGGWLQVNNTIIPFVHRENSLLKFVPLSVVKYAAGLLTDTTLNGYELTQEECIFLTNICTKAGLAFNFKRYTKALSINLVCQLSENVIVKELPQGDPFAHAEHSEDGMVESPANKLPVTQSISPPEHSPPKSTYSENVPVDCHHSTDDSLMENKSYTVVAMGGPSSLFDQRSQALSKQLQPSQKHLGAIQQLHNRYLPRHLNQHAYVYPVPTVTCSPVLHAARSSVNDSSRLHVSYPQQQLHMLQHHQMTMHSEGSKKVGEP